jgi:DNA-binding CsgD family transcriptional regulator
VTTTDHQILELARTAGCTPKQLAVLELVSQGYGYRRISILLDIDQSTVRDHLSAAFRRIRRQWPHSPPGTGAPNSKPKLNAPSTTPSAKAKRQPKRSSTATTGHPATHANSEASPSSASTAD